MNLRIFTLLFIICLIIFSCRKEEKDDNDGIIRHDVIIIEENIDISTTWLSNNVYIIRKYDFFVTNTLKIQPGVTVKFHPADGPYLLLGRTGIINAQGTVDNPIVFTSFKDDDHGGDSNNDGNVTQPKPKDWGDINTNGKDGSIFKYCEFRYGGDALFNATLTLYGNNIRVENCKFINNDGSYDHIGALNASNAGKSTIIKNNIFYGNKRPLSISSSFNIDNSNIFHNPDDSLETNQFNGIFVYMLNSITDARQWQETEVAYIIDGYQRYINTNGTLTLGDNVVIKFKGTGELWLEKGASQLKNYNGFGVYFTSYKDDTKKGDTNGDGNSSSPANGDWSGIYDNSLSLPSPHFYTWSNIHYDTY